MNITNIPLNEMVDKDGKIHHSWRIFFNQIVNQMQTFLSDERYKLPDQPVKENTSVSDLNIKDSEGGLLYDNIEKVGKINTEDGHNNVQDPPTYSFKRIATYEQLTQSQVNAIKSGQRNGRIIFETDTGMTKLGSNDTFITL